MKILVIEDDQLVADMLVEILTHQAYAVETVRDGGLGWELLTTYDYDLVILDLLLPKIDGLELCRKLRNADNHVPVLILTGRNNTQDKVIGLDAGADDYLGKPFDPEELLARVRVLLRRHSDMGQTQLSWGDLQLDPVSCQVSYQMQPITLTPKEYALTELFLRNPKRIFSCSAILDHLWSYEEAPGEEAVRTHIKGLRQKLKASSQGLDLIETVYGIGYRLRSIANSGADNAPGSLPDHASVVPVSDDTSALQGMIQRIWQEARPRIQNQLGMIQTMLTAYETHQISPELHAQGLQEAHTLAGALGTFGLPQGSQLAKSMEMQLKATALLTKRQLKQIQTDFTALQQIINQAYQESALATHDQQIVNQPVEAINSSLNSSNQQASYTKRLTLLVIDPNTQVVQELLQDANFQNFQVSLTKRLSHAKSKIQVYAPDVILFDPDVAGSLEEGVQFLQQLHEDFPQLPIVTFTKYSDLLERQKMLKSGGSVFLSKPAQSEQIKSEQILQAVQQAIAQKSISQDLMEQAKRPRFQVLVVDDDPTILSLSQHLLQPWGLQVTVLAEPRQFWPTLEMVQPDLLVLDIMMPEISGLELCEMVRNDAQWSDLPILFLTVANDAETINQVFSLGADDFVPKPIVGPELVTRVINRLERTKLMQQRYRTRQFA